MGRESLCSRPNFGMSRLSRPTARLMSRLFRLSAGLCNLGLNPDTARPSKSENESGTSTRGLFDGFICLALDETIQFRTDERVENSWSLSCKTFLLSVKKKHSEFRKDQFKFLKSSV